MRRSMSVLHANWVREKSQGYSGVRFSRSIDLVSISWFLRRYSRIIPGGWYLRRNLLSFILLLKFEFNNYSQFFPFIPHSYIL